MAIESFTWCPRINAEQDVSFRRRTAQFGDGYQQAAGDGLNPRSQNWKLQFTGDATLITEIKAFLDRHHGVKAFQWKPPLEPTGLYRCDKYTPVALGAGMYSLSLTFEQAFKP